MDRYQAEVSINSRYQFPGVSNRGQVSTLTGVKFCSQTSIELAEENCKGFICEESGLTEISIVHLLQKENYIRNTFAGVRELSNMYSVVGLGM